MRRLLLLLAAALGLLASGSAGAQSTASVYYQPDGESARVTVGGDEGTFFRIYAEQLDSSYALASHGVIGWSGQASRMLPVLGPVDSMPQFRVVILAPGEDEIWISLADKEYALD